MVILGIDPGTASTGYGLIKIAKGSWHKSVSKKIKEKLECLDYGLIKTEPTLSAGNRLKKLNNALSKIIKKYRPVILVIESLYFFRNLKTAIPVSQASGVIILTAAKNNIPVCNFTPLQVKMTVAGHGWAEKKQVQEKMKKLLKLKEIPRPDDAADALAIALTYFLKSSAPPSVKPGLDNKSREIIMLRRSSICPSL